jgi:hypothetical protein
MHDTEIDGSEIIGEGDVVFAKIRSAVRHSLIAFDAHSCIQLIAFDAHSCIQLIAFNAHSSSRYGWLDPGIAAEFLEVGSVQSVRMAPIFSAQRHTQRECQRRIYI